jgi:predicted enzyme related to lactoylglutathione lyase
MPEPGLTHLSVNTDDLEAALARVAAHGGEVLTATHVGVAVMVRDPDGQLLELIQPPGG